MHIGPSMEWTSEWEGEMRWLFYLLAIGFLFNENVHIMMNE